MATPRKEAKIRKGMQELDKITTDVMNGNPHSSNLMDRVGEIFETIGNKDVAKQHGNVDEDAKVRTEIATKADKRLGKLIQDDIKKENFDYVMLRSTGLPSYKAGVLAYKDFRFHKWGLDIILDAKVKMIFNKKENELKEYIKQHSIPAINEVDINRVERYMFDSIYEDMQTAEAKDKAALMNVMTKLIKNISDRDSMNQPANTQPYVLKIIQQNNAIPNDMLKEDPIINVGDLQAEVVVVEDPCV